MCDCRLTVGVDLQILASWDKSPAYAWCYTKLCPSVKRKTHRSIKAAQPDGIKILRNTQRHV